MRPDAFFDGLFDVPPPRLKMSADERLDYLDSLTSTQGRVILQLDENRGWSLKETVLLEGRLGVRHAIDDFALERGHHPPPLRRASPPPDSSSVIRGGRRRAHEALILSLCLVASLLLIIAISCPDPYPDDLRESGLSLSCPPHRGSDGNTAVRTPPASRERSPSVVAGRPSGPAQPGGPVLLLCRWGS